MKQKLKIILEQITDQFGQEAIMLLGQKSHLKTDVIPSGSLVVDQLLGIGGYPRGRIVEIFGPESSGKTTLALHAIAEVQKLGKIAAFVDAEHAIDPHYALNLGVDVNNLILSQPDSGEQALEIVNILANSQAVDLIVVDSVAALVPEAELNGEMRDQTIGAQARLMSKALRKITATLSKTQTTVIFINQIRSKIGVMFGNPETTSGGRALKFYASIRLDIRRVATIKSGQEIKGNTIKFKVVKNKLAPPFKIGQSEIIFAYGINKTKELIVLAEAAGILERKGSWYLLDGTNLAQGQNKLQTLLEKDEQLYHKLYQQLLETKPI